MHVDAIGIVDGAMNVAEAHDLASRLVQELRGDRADVAEALHDDPRALEGHLLRVAGLARDDKDAAPRRLDAPRAAADRDGLAGDDAMNAVAVVHGERVHDPRHDLRVGVDVGRRNIHLGADHPGDLSGVAAREPLQLGHRELRRIEDDAALAAAEGDVHHGALPRHPHRQRPHLVERDMLVVADAALGRAAIGVVLHTIAGEDLNGAVVHAHGEANGNLTLGLAQDGAHRLGQIETLGGGIELLNGFLKRGKSVGRRRTRRRSACRGLRRLSDLRLLCRLHRFLDCHGRSSSSSSPSLACHYWPAGAPLLLAKVGSIAFWRPTRASGDRENARTKHVSPVR